mmetsp:Transcript_5423/g.8011  ORF Transcript_5423/g.8011 Transcript_5423/m.8011 type:complete len:525 (+) Transcript_5423:278-1852(+)
MGRRKGDYNNTTGFNSLISQTVKFCIFTNLPNSSDIPDQDFAHFFLPKPHNMDPFRQDSRGTFEIGFGEKWFVSHPITIHSNSQYSNASPEIVSSSQKKKGLVKGSSSSNTSSNTSSDKSKKVNVIQTPDLKSKNHPKEKIRSLVALSVVFAVRKSMESHPLSEKIRIAAKTLAYALRSEEVRCGYLSEELRTISSRRHSDKKEAIGQDKRRLKTCMDEVSAQLASSKMARVTINGWLGIDLSISVPLMSFEQVRPHHTFLLANRVSSTLRKLPPAPSPSLVSLIRAHDPTKTFQELSHALCMSVEQVMELGFHLVTWQLAKIVPSIRSYSIYGLSPEGSDSIIGNGDGCRWVLGKLSEEFDATFKTKFSLVSFLAIFNQRIELKRCVAKWTAKGMSKKNLSLMLRWAVNKRLVATYLKYLYMLPPNDDGVKKDSLSHLDDGSIEFLILRGLYCNGHLNGTHDVDEILWRWNRDIADEKKRGQKSNARESIDSSSKSYGRLTYVKLSSVVSKYSDHVVPVIRAS